MPPEFFTQSGSSTSFLFCSTIKSTSLSVSPLSGSTSPSSLVIMEMSGLAKDAMTVTIVVGMAGPGPVGSGLKSVRDGIFSRFAGVVCTCTGGSTLGTCQCGPSLGLREEGRSFRGGIVTFDVDAEVKVGVEYSTWGAEYAIMLTTSVLVGKCML